MRPILGDIPGQALKRAILEFRQGSTWFPTVNEIRAKAEAKCQHARVARAAIDGQSAGRVIAQVKRMIGYEEKQSRVLEQSRNWPDPTANKRVVLKPFHVGKDGQRIPATSFVSQTLSEE
jgi:hypothetical protein